MSESVGLSVSHYTNTVDSNFFVRLDPDMFGDFQQLEYANNYYFIVNGVATVTYASNNTSEILNSPYASGWSEYVDSPIYSENVSIKLSNTSSFSWIRANTLVPLSIKVGKVNNDTITTNANANSILLIYGNDVSYNGSAISKDSEKLDHHRIEIAEDQIVTIGSANTSVCYLIEWI